MSPAPSTAIEGFAVETHDGLVFTVKGLVHPPDRRIAYVRYVPDPGGDRVRGGRRYRKLRTFAEQLAALERVRDVYLRRDACAGAVLQSVPAEAAARVHDPRRRLADLAAAGPSGALEEAALRLSLLLAETAAVPASALGVTGSLLVGLQTPASDLDLVVYGGEACRAVRAALGGLLDAASGPVRRPGEAGLAAIHAEHRRETPLAAADFARLQAAKANEGRFEGREFFVRFVRRADEAGERYGDVTYEPVGAATVEARVRDAGEAIFTPCRYGVEGARLVEGARAGAGAQEAAVRASIGELREIVSFRGRFADQARAGERVRARGTLERVAPRRGAPYARLVVGAAGDHLASLPG